MGQNTLHGSMKGTGFYISDKRLLKALEEKVTKLGFNKVDYLKVLMYADLLGEVYKPKYISISEDEAERYYVKWEEMGYCTLEDLSDATGANISRLRACLKIYLDEHKPHDVVYVQEGGRDYTVKNFADEMRRRKRMARLVLSK